MINAYSLAAETLEGTLDENYPVINKISEMKLRPKMRLSDKTLMLLKNFGTIQKIMNLTLINMKILKIHLVINMVMKVMILLKD